eukprot:3899757-Rhodomonas_salina.2
MAHAYAMSSSENASIVLRTRYAMSGTDKAYAGDVYRRHGGQPHGTNALSASARATRCPVLNTAYDVIPTYARNAR